MGSRRGCDSYENHVAVSSQFAPDSAPVFKAKSSLNSHRHYNTAVAVILGAFDHSRTQTVLQFDDDVVLLHRRERVEDVSRIEADRQLGAGIVDPHGLLGLPEIVTGRGQRQGVRRQYEAYRFV